ncbi:MAG: hypothetical protein ACK5MZ_05495 [Aestuariibaculum sp.]
MTETKNDIKKAFRVFLYIADKETNFSIGNSDYETDWKYYDYDRYSL